MGLGAISVSNPVVDGFKPEPLPGLVRPDTEEAEQDDSARVAKNKSLNTDTVESEKDTDGPGSEELSQEDLQQIAELKRRDAEVRAHEQAHAAVGGRYAGSPSYEYQRGPDGRQYAVGGEVSIDVSPARSPEATITKMQIVRAAALAPANPSGADRAVASTAASLEGQARAELAKQKREERAEAAEKNRPKNEDGVGYTTGDTKKAERKGEFVDVFA